MKRLALALVVCLLTLGGSAWGMEKWQNWCQQGGVKVSMPGLGTSTNKFMQTFPSCTVTVYLTGTTNLATLYSDNGVTPKANPFTADSTTGYAFFYAADGTYDVKFSGTGISVPFTLSGFLLSDTSSLPVIVTSYCASAGIYDQTCWNNAIAAVPPGGIIQDTLCKDFTISSSVNITKSVHLRGCGPGTEAQHGTRLLAANGAVTPILNGNGNGSIISAWSLDNMRIEGVYTASQKCAYFNYFNHVDMSRVQFYNCGVASDIDYGFLLRSTDVDFANCGSGDTAATACVRVENRSNPSVATEQVWFNHNTWGCDQVNRTNQGLALYLGPATNQSYARGSKFDYTSCSFTARVIALYQTTNNLIQDNSIAVGSVTYPTTGSALIDLDGTVGTQSTKNNIQNNYLLFWTSTPAVKVNYGSNNIISGNNLEGSGSGTAITLTANSGGNQAGPNWLLSADTYLSNASLSNIALSEKIDSTYAWWFRDRLVIGATPATTGVLGLPNNTCITFRNAANSGDVSALCLNGSDIVQLGTTANQTNVLGDFAVPKLTDTALNVALSSGSTVAENINLLFQDRSSTKWNLLKDTNNDFFITDSVAAVSRLGFTHSGNNVYETGGGSEQHIFKTSAGATQVTISSAGLLTAQGGFNGNSAGAAALGALTGITTASMSGQLTSTLTTGTAPFVIASTTPVANLTAVPTTYNHSGTQQTATHLVQDSCTLGTDCAVTLTGSAVYTSSTSYTCACADDTAIAACKVAQSSGSAFTITGTGTDSIRYVCVGN